MNIFFFNAFKRLLGMPVDEGKSKPWTARKYFGRRISSRVGSTKAHHARRSLRKSKRQMQRDSRRANRG